MSTVRRFWIPATALSTLGWSEGDVELMQATDFDALREELAHPCRTIARLMERVSAAEQRNAELVDLLDEVLNEVPHGWGASFRESDLAERIRQAINPAESGASE